jgi:hypothetical protein
VSEQKAEYPQLTTANLKRILAGKKSGGSAVSDQVVSPESDDEAAENLQSGDQGASSASESSNDEVLFRPSVREQKRGASAVEAEEPPRKSRALPNQDEGGRATKQEVTELKKQLKSVIKRLVAAEGRIAAYKVALSEAMIATMLDKVVQHIDAKFQDSADSSGSAARSSTKTSAKSKSKKRSSH